VFESAAAVSFQQRNRRSTLIHVVATVELHPNVRPSFLAALHSLTPQVQAEVGCLAYRPCIDIPSGLAPQIPQRPDTVTIIEKWAILDALKAHAIAPHMQAYRARVAPLVAKTTLQVLAEPPAG
jgi:quinol monooxygenase YgiN